MKRSVIEEESSDDFLSDSDGEASGAVAHAKLLADVQGIVKKTRLSGPTSAGSKLRCVSQGSTGVDRSVLVSLTRTATQALCREAAPKSKQEGKRVERRRGFEDVREDVNKWEKLVDHQRTARQVSFPLNDNSVSILEADKQFQPPMKTDLERDMYELFNEAGLMKSKQETVEQKDQRIAMSLDEVRERNQESWRLKLLWERRGKKANLRNKTKSKKFHRICNKDKLRKEVAELQLLEKTDPDLAMERLKKLDDIRIEERMSLKHKKSKWAQSLQLRAKTDKGALVALQENSRLHKDMVSKIQSKEDLKKNEDTDSETDSSDDNDPATVAINCEPAPGIESQSYIRMKQFWGEYSRQKEGEIIEELQNRRRLRGKEEPTADNRTIEEADNIVRNKLSELNSKKNEKTNMSDNIDERPTITQFECDFSSTNKPNRSMLEVSERLRTLEDCDDVQSSSNREFSAKSLKLTADDTSAKPQGLPVVESSTNIKLMETTLLPSHDLSVNELFNSDDEDSGGDDIFDEDDLALEAFNKEKTAAEEAATIKDVCYALPGWGDWSGPGIEMSQKKKEKFTEKAPKKKKSKFDKSNVIYNEAADVHKNIRDRMVTELPFPFLQVSDYEASIRGVAGPNFVPQKVHKQLVQQPIKTKMGTVIKPMDQSELVKDPTIKQAIELKMKLKGQLPTDEITKTKKRKSNKLHLCDSSVRIKKFSRKTTAARIN